MTLDLNKTKPPPRFKMWWSHVSQDYPHLTQEQAAMLAVLSFAAEIDGIHTAGPTFKEALDITLRKLGVAGMLTPPRGRSTDVPRPTVSSHQKDGQNIPPVHETPHDARTA